MAFKAPCDCTAVAGLKAYFPNTAGTITNQIFLFTDAHGNNLTGLGHLFKTGAIVKAILNVDEGKAYIQNADTNAYLEGKFETKAPAGYGLGSIAKDISNTDLLDTLQTASGGFYMGINVTNAPDNNWWFYIVVSHNNIWSTVLALSFTGNNHVMYIGQYTDGTWAGWKKFATAEDVNSAVSGKATTVTYTAMVPVAWTANGTGFKQTVAESGILATDRPVVGLVQTGTIATDATLREAWNMVTRIECATNSITVYCDEEAPTVAIPIQIICVR